MQHFQGLMALLREASLVHEHYTVDGKIKLAMAALAVDGTGEHCLYLNGSSPAGTLVKMRVKGTKDTDVTEEFLLGFLPLQVSNCQIEGKSLGGSRGTHND